MLAGATQKNRIAQLTTPLGPDKLLLTSFNAVEELSRPFEIRIEAESADANLDFDAALGRNCAIRFVTQTNKTRHFSGILVEATWTGTILDRHEYELVLRPWLWLLTQASENRIFQMMSVVEVLQKVFTDIGFTNVELKLQESYPKFEYCVQYNESHFAFVSRLMERCGIYYYFKHESDKHILVLADAKGSHTAIPDLPRCRFLPNGDRLRDQEENLSRWHVGRVFRTGRVTVNAFDFDKPNANLHHSQSQPGGHQHDSLELYENIEKYKHGQEEDLGQKYAKALLHSRQSQDRRRTAEGDAPSLFPGGLVTIDGQLNQAEKKEYLVVSASHAFVGEAYASGYGAGTDNSYQGRYVLQPSDRPYKAPIVTPWPKMSGPQTATVTGPKGEEIHTDKHGRVKVQFHWDRQGKRDEKSSRWVRVAQMHSGKGWGSLVLPRIGMEVVVEFIEGDPDRPLIVGTVYNGDNPVPYGQPANKTQSGIKTRSSKNGGEGDYNEFMFEDKKGSEFVRLHAEKDYNVTIEDRETKVVKGKNKGEHGDAKKLGGPDDNDARVTTIEKGDDNLIIKVGNQKLHVGNDQGAYVIGHSQLEAKKSITFICGGSKIEMLPTKITITTDALEMKDKVSKHESTMSMVKKSPKIELN